MPTKEINHETTLPTIITLTLPTPEGGGIAPERATATLLIQRGDLAHVRQFHYDNLFNAVREASTSLGLLEDNHPSSLTCRKKNRNRHPNASRRRCKKRCRTKNRPSRFRSRKAQKRSKSVTLRSLVVKVMPLLIVRQHAGRSAD